MKKNILTITLLILTLSLSYSKTNAQEDSGGFSNGPEGSLVVEGLALSENKISFSNYPNPIINSTNIKYVVPANGLVSLKLFNSAGKEVASIFEGYKKAGTYKQVFNAAKLSKGTYVCKLTVLSVQGKVTATRLLNISK